jgi:sec-independent protein translocase protein TatA
MPSWIGPWEIVIIVVIILLIFGGRLLPRLGSSFGRSVVGLKKGLKEGQEEFTEAIKEDTKGAKVDTTAEGGAADTGAKVEDRADETSAKTEKTEQS